MTPQLRTALEAVVNMKRPCIASILRHRGYNYEARQMQALTEAYELYKDTEPEECPQER